MGYILKDIEKVEAFKITGSYKTDVQVQVRIYLKKEIDVQNLSIKLVSNPRGYNQIDKRRIDKYVDFWDIPEDIAKILKLYTGEKEPYKKDVRDKRRMFLDEMKKSERLKLLEFCETNKILIISDILRGRGKFSADWMLVVLNINNHSKWDLKSINYVMNFFGNGKVKITKKGNLKIGKITVQRKGGDGGRDSAKMLQFKMNPAEILDN